jgi:hypothetical protein
MKLTISLIVFLLFCGYLFAQNIQPAPSPLGKTTQVVGVTEVSVEYSRPGIKGRPIFGDKVPFGEVWRTGANAVTKLTFSTDVTLEGRKIPAGSYGLYTIPNKNEWKILINKVAEGNPDYKAEEDIASFKVKAHLSPNVDERFTIEIADMTDSTAVILLKWAQTRVPIKLEVDTKANVEKNVEAFEDAGNDDNAGGWYQVANYYFGKKEYGDALDAVDKSLEIDSNPFWVLRLKSRILAVQGDYEEAIVFAKKSLVSATKAGNEENVKINEEAIKEWQAKLAE